MKVTECVVIKGFSSESRRSERENEDLAQVDDDDGVDGSVSCLPTSSRCFCRQLLLPYVASRDL